MKLTKRTMQTMCGVSILGLMSVCANGQATGEPAAETKKVEPALTGHEGHNHADPASSNGVAPTSVHQVPTRPGQTPPEASGPSVNSIMLFKETTVSTGTILDNEPVLVEFEFKNTGAQALEIQLVKPSCGCTVPDMDQESYAPGEKGVLKVTFDPSAKRGAISRAITIYTNSKTKPVHTIYLHSFVKPVIIAEPRILAFDMIQKGNSATKDIKIFGRNEGFKINRATTQDSQVFGIEIIDGGKVEKDGDNMWLQIIRVTILESATPSSHRTEITVRTNDKDKPLFTLAVVGRVLGDLELMPVRMTMGRLVVGDSFEREITLKSRSGKSFEIKAVNSANVVLDATYTATPVDAEKRDEWILKVAGTVIHPAQRFNAQMNVITDVADEEMVEVQMYGQLQPQKP